ncbi:unnamed protein product [Moneuplotes crassus]|uniref:Uncharacterized protein n=1 Tax=Euplotes crassus TaxID=5936 RepID=A0AAD1UPT0_EUPCR|nr:unnamed protein product [Moneuplotes crassus]
MRTPRMLSTVKIANFGQSIGGEKAPIEKVKVMRKFKFNYLHNLPYDLSGTHAIPKLQERNLVEVFLDYKVIDDEFLTDKFHEMLVDLYTAISNKDNDKISSLTETRFCERIQNSARETEESLEFIPNEIPHIERAPEDQSYIFDKIFEKGVFFDREKNDTNYDYFLDKMFESEGIRYYQHKYIADHDIHYYLAKYEQQHQDREARFNYKYFAEERNRSMVLRVYGVFKNLGRFKNQGKDLVSKKYTGNHMVIFENQLHESDILELTDPDMEEWIKNYKINHNNWKITDIDNYMKGNPFFSKMMDASEFKDFVSQVKKKNIPTEKDLPKTIGKYNLLDDADQRDDEQIKKMEEFLAKNSNFGK